MAQGGVAQALNTSVPPYAAATKQQQAKRRVRPTKHYHKYSGPKHAPVLGRDLGRHVDVGNLEHDSFAQERQRAQGARERSRPVLNRCEHRFKHDWPVRKVKRPDDLDRQSGGVKGGRGGGFSAWAAMARGYLVELSISWRVPQPMPSGVCRKNIRRYEEGMIQFRPLPGGGDETTISPPQRPSYMPLETVITGDKK